MSGDAGIELEGLEAAAADPSTRGGYRVVLAREVPLEIRLQTDEAAPQDAGTLEAVQCKVLVLGDASASSPSAVRVELSSETDLFFHYSSTVDEKTFRALRDEQHLMIEFSEFVNVLGSSFGNAVKEPHTFLAVLIMNTSGQARLDFIQNCTVKFVELLSLPFTRSSDDAMRQSVTYRYSKVKAQCALVQSKLQEVVALVKVKNPSLLLALTQKPAAVGTPGMGLSGTLRH